MEKLEDMLKKNEENQKKRDLGVPDNSKPVEMGTVKSIKRRAVGDVINIDNTLYKVRKITRKDIILRQMSQEEVNKFKEGVDKMRREHWKKMWEEKIASNPNTVYKNPEDKTPEGGHWYCLRHFREKYDTEPRMYTDVYSLKDQCKVCQDAGEGKHLPRGAKALEPGKEDYDVVIEPPANIIEFPGKKEVK